MQNRMNNIAIIPARCGSKEIKDKNIKLFNGKPLLSYTIESALQSGIFQEVIVSTDSPIYAEIAKKYGANVPFLRSIQYAGDEVSSWEAICEVLRYKIKQGINYDICALLQPTSPLRTSNHMKEAYNLFVENNANAVVSICEVEHPVQWCFEIGSDGNMEKFSNSIHRNARRQDIPASFRENGAIYLVKPEIILYNNNDIYEKKCYGYIMNKEYSIDIDSMNDFEIAEILYQKYIG